MGGSPGLARGTERRGGHPDPGKWAAVACRPGVAVPGATRPWASRRGPCVVTCRTTRFEARLELCYDVHQDYMEPLTTELTRVLGKLRAGEWMERVAEMGRGADWQLLGSYAGLLGLAVGSIYAGAHGSLPVCG